MNPIISVIVCTYNRGELLVQALESLVAQSLEKSRYEVIVVNNNSTDNTEEIKRLTEELTQASHKLAEAMYAQASQQQQAQDGGAPGPEAAADASQDEEVVDADFEEVKK